MTVSTADKKKRLLKSLAALVFWVAIWFIAAGIVGQELILPSPAAVAVRILKLGKTGEFWLATGLSLLRIIAGLLAGTVIGTVIGALTAFSPAADTLLSPAMKIVRATPVASFITLTLLWIGKSRVPGFISALMVAPMMWGSVMTAVAETDRQLLEMAEVYRFSTAKKLRYIYLPAVLPTWKGSFTAAMGYAWKSGIAAEVLCYPKNAIGTQLHYSRIYLETADLFAWTIVVIILSFVLEKGFAQLIKGGKR